MLLQQSRAQLTLSTLDPPTKATDPPLPTEAHFQAGEDFMNPRAPRIALLIREALFSVHPTSYGIVLGVLLSPEQYTQVSAARGTVICDL